MNRHQGPGGRTRRNREQGGWCAAFGPHARSVLSSCAGTETWRYRWPNTPPGAPYAARRWNASRRRTDSSRRAPTPAPGPELRQRLAARIAAARALVRIARPDTCPCAHREDNRCARCERRERFAMDENRNSDDADWETLAADARAGGHGGGGAGRSAAGGSIRGKDARNNQPGGMGMASARRLGMCAPGKISAQLPANNWLSDLTMVSPDEGWAVGSVSSASVVSSSGGGAIIPTPSLQSLESTRALILHFHNCTWTPVATDYPGARLLSISMDSASDGWAVGNASGKPLALHYTNGAWTSVTLPEQSALQGSFEGSAYALLRRGMDCR